MVRRPLGIAALVCLLVTLSVTAGAAAADPAPEPRAEAARYLDAGRLHGFDRAFHAAPRAAARGLRYPEDFPAEAVARIATLEASLHEKALAPFREVLIDIFVERLTPTQLTAAADFMASPAGQARAAYLHGALRAPELQVSPVFAIDDELSGIVRTAAAATGLVVPAEE